jgi:acetyl-CoA carboxylase biotin carboxyl carrier protein
MFKFQEICELIRLVGESGIAAVEVEHAGSRLRIEGPPRTVIMEAPAVAGVGPAVPVTRPASVVVSGTTSASPSPGVSAEAPETEDEAGLHFVTSPIVGTFYRAPSPDADPYVKVGDSVTKGQVLCIVEAMKLMNEIESDMSGTIVKVLSDNAQPVEFGQRLFAIRPA